MCREPPVDFCVSQLMYLNTKITLCGQVHKEPLYRRGRGFGEGGQRGQGVLVAMTEPDAPRLTGRSGAPPTPEPAGCAWLEQMRPFDRLAAEAVWAWGSERGLQSGLIQGSHQGRQSSCSGRGTGGHRSHGPRSAGSPERGGKLDAVPGVTGTRVQKGPLGATES